jgi:NAD(P)-dependent dehydrogenase (short-subunit alcohol dehydrogenase family)
VQVSSAAAKLVYPGLAVYGAGKAAMEQWVRGVRSERRHRGTGPWVIAVRPGFVDTPATRREATLSAEEYPGAPDIAKALDDGFALQPEDSARQLWAALPPAADSRTVLFIGEAVTPRT